MEALAIRTRIEAPQGGAGPDTRAPAQGQTFRKLLKKKKKLAECTRQEGDIAPAGAGEPVASRLAALEAGQPAERGARVAGVTPPPSTDSPSELKQLTGPLAEVNWALLNPCLSGMRINAVQVGGEVAMTLKARDEPQRKQLKRHFATAERGSPTAGAPVITANGTSR